ncbi:MAG TPA: cytochrome P450, partial [Ilumatobacteraceae bacterium]|nr:cytochrome P450 [Ilumatobacteraceae bacterium]
IAEAGTNLDAMIREVIEWKRKHPDDRLLSMLIEAEDDGDVLDDDELAAQVLLLFVAGHETTVNLIGNGVKALVDHPDELAKLRAEPGLIEGAVEEILRYDSPVQMSRRINLSDHELHGTTIPKGTFIVAGLAAANRDPRQFGETAGRLDITRADAREHVAFGGGAHYCLGAALARLEAQIAIGSLVNRFASIEPRADAVYNGRINLRGLDTYDVALA